MFLQDIINNHPSNRPFKGQIIVLGTINDKDTFEAVEKFEKLFPGASVHVFSESGGHHYLFLHPEEYTRVLKEKLLEILKIK